MIINPCLIQYNFACDRAIIVPILNVHHRQFMVSKLAANIGLTVNLTTTYNELPELLFFKDTRFSSLCSIILDIIYSWIIRIYTKCTHYIECRTLTNDQF